MIPPRVLVGGVGYRFLRDFSVGPWLADQLAAQAWPDHVLVEDLGYGPVAVRQRLEDFDPPLERLIVAGSVERGRAPGTVTAYRWNGELPPADEVQVRVSEAVTGVVDLDNLVVVVGALGPAPAEFVVVEVEADVEEHGTDFSPAVAGGAERAAALVRLLALAEGLPEGVASAPPGGPPVTEETAANALEARSH